MTDPRSARGLLVEITVPAGSHAVPLVRGAFRAAIGSEPWCDRDDFLSVATELMSNAIRHGSRDGEVIRARCLLQDDAVRIEVHDQSRSGPRMRVASDDDPTGRGLLLVDGMAGAWGSYPTPDGKAVWAQMPRPGRAVELA